jgi:hypothetical protein
MKFCELYLIQENMDGPIKIGRAASTEARRRQLQTGNPRGLRVVQLYTLEFDEAVEAERRLHEELEERRMCGEWFNVSEKFITEYVPLFFKAVGFEFVVGDMCGE